MADLYATTQRYTDIQDAIIKELLKVSTLDFTEETVGVDLDEIVTEMFEKDLIFGAIIVPGGARRMPRETFSHPSGGSGLTPDLGRSWTWFVEVVILIRFKDSSLDPTIPTTTEQELNLRKIYDSFRVFLVGRERLGGLVGKAEVISISDPDGMRINDIPYYLVTVTVEVLDKS